MKKIIFVAAVALALCSCAKTELTGVEAGEMLIGASMEAYSSGTKAALADAGSFTWQTGDAIEVATSGGHSTFNLNSGAGEASATFSAIYSGTLGNYAVYPADIFVSESKITIPASREWSEGNTNCSMFGNLSEGNVAFKHLGGVIKVTLNGVPAEAKKFVFSTPGKKITGEFDLNTGTGTDTEKYIETADDNNNANSSYTLSFTLSQAQNMAFYIPVPCGTYPKFAFKVLGDDDVVLNEFAGSSQQVVNRKDILIMPTLTIGTITGGGDDAEQGAISKTVPAGTKGSYRLPAAEKVILNFEGEEDPGEDVINLVYDGDSQLPSKLWLRVASGKKVNVSGNLQHTTVVFDQGVIYNADFKTAQNTFKIIAPARIEEKLTVKGGNVEISGPIDGGADNVKAIEIVVDATADDSSAPVQITLENQAKVGIPEQGGEGGITTSANVVIVNNTDAEVNVAVPEDAKETVQVASAGTGTGEVKKDGEKVTTKPAAAIGTQNFITLSDAITSIPEENGQTVTINILENIVLKASEALTINKNNVVLDGQGHTITLDETDTNLDKYKEDGDNKKYGSFQMIKVTGNDVVLRNLTLDSKDYRGVSLATTWGGKNATYQNIVYNGKGSGHYYGYAASEGTLTFIGCTFNTCGYAIHTAESTTDLVVTNCNIDGWVSYGDKTKSATFTNCKFYKAEDKHNGTLATVRPYCGTTFTGCSFSSDYLTDSPYTGITVRSNVVVSLKECTVDGGGNLYDLANITNPDDSWVAGGVLAINAEGDATNGFTAGTFVAKQASDIKVKSGYACHEIEGKSNIYGIHEIDAVATIGSVKYETLAAALDAASENDVVMLCKDIIRNVESNNSDRETYFVSGKKITLDLNGHIIKHRYGQNKYGVFEVKNSTFTIDDSSVEKNGKIADTYAQAVLYVENSTVNLKNGLLAAEYSSTSSTNYRVVKLKNSTFTMDGGSVLAATTGNYNRAFEFVHSTGTNSKVIVNNGVIKTHTSYAVVFYGDSGGYQGENNMVEINGGEISTEGNYGWLGDDLFGEIVMNGGSFTSNWHQVVDTNTKFTHNGGTVNIKSN